MRRESIFSLLWRPRDFVLTCLVLMTERHREFLTREKTISVIFKWSVKNYLALQILLVFSSFQLHHWHLYHFLVSGHWTLLLTHFWWHNLKQFSLKTACQPDGISNTLMPACMVRTAETFWSLAQISVLWWLTCHRWLCLSNFILTYPIIMSYQVWSWNTTHHHFSHKVQEHLRTEHTLCCHSVIRENQCVISRLGTAAGWQNLPRVGHLYCSAKYDWRTNL